MAQTEFGKLSFYEIYPTSFYDSDGDGIGDIKGIIAKLPYVRSLGFTGIWFNPFFKSPFRDGGYDISDFFAIDPRFGTDADVRKLISECHRLGLTVLFDLVAGHMSWDAEPFLESTRAETNKWSDMFVWTDNPWSWEQGLRLVRGLYDRNGAYLANFFVHQPALNYGFLKPDRAWQEPVDGAGPAKTKKYIESVMEYWCAQGVDGFRCDMAGWMVKKDNADNDGTIRVWDEMFGAVRKKYPAMKAVSEWNCPRNSLRSAFDADFVLEWSEDFYHQFARRGAGLKGLYAAGEKGEPLLRKWDPALWKTWEKQAREYFAAQRDSGKWLSLISGNHDTARIADWLDQDDLRLAYTLLFLLPNVPFMFQGDEIGQTTYAGLPSKDGGYLRTGTRTPMRWDNTPNAGFSTAAPEALYLPTHAGDDTVAEQEADPDSLLNFVRKMNAIRSSDPDITMNYDLRIVEGRPLSFWRKRTLVVANLSTESYSFAVGAGTLLAAFGKPTVAAGKLVVPTRGVAVYREA